MKRYAGARRADAASISAFEADDLTEVDLTAPQAQTESSETYDEENDDDDESDEAADATQINASAPDLHVHEAPSAQARRSLDLPDLEKLAISRGRTATQRRDVAREIVGHLKPMLDPRIEPQNVSREKAAMLSCFRPTNLPPKSRKEDKRHLKEYERLLRKSLKHEDLSHRKQGRFIIQRAKHLTNAADIWEEEILPALETGRSDSRTKALSWKGLPTRCRGRVWAVCIGNALGLSDDTFSTALANARETLRELREKRADGQDDSGELITLASFEAIDACIDETYADLGLFQGEGPLFAPLRDVLHAYRFYRADVEFNKALCPLAALLLLNVGAPEAFVMIANLLNRPLMLALYTLDRPVVDRRLAALSTRCSLHLPELHKHLHVDLGLGPRDYLDAPLRSLFAAQMPIEVVSRVWDVYLFEGDAFLIRMCLALLQVLETALYGNEQEVLDIMAGKDREHIWKRRLFEDDFMERVKRF
ncbi:hypothetical protein PYCC9005_004854 [Savitreella phatthalungensis]